MMRTTKSGEPSIPKAIWDIKASMHRTFADELSVIAHAAGLVRSGMLEPNIKRHLALADACDELAAETRRGRPKSPVTKAERGQNRLADILLGIPPKRKPGRPSAAGKDYDEMTYRAVEEKRKELALSNKAKPTIRAAIDSLNSQIARDNGVRESQYLKDNFDHVHSAYKRGRSKLLAKVKT